MRQNRCPPRIAVANCGKCLSYAVYFLTPLINLNIETYPLFALFPSLYTFLLFSSGFALVLPSKKSGLVCIESISWTVVAANVWQTIRPDMRDILVYAFFFATNPLSRYPFPFLQSIQESISGLKVFISQLFCKVAFFILQQWSAK